MASSAIADRVRMFELFTNMKIRAQEDKDKQVVPCTVLELSSVLMVRLVTGQEERLITNAFLVSGRRLC